MYWPDEVREPDFEVLDKEVDIRKQELQMAASLVENLSADFDPSEFEDEYRHRLEEAVQQKIDGQEVAMPAAAEAAAPVVDLMEALKASVEATKKGAAKAEKEEAPKAKAKAG
jgi:DNA end-binding protein Ku